MNALRRGGLVAMMVVSAACEKSRAPVDGPPASASAPATVTSASPLPVASTAPVASAPAPASASAAVSTSAATSASAPASASAAASVARGPVPTAHPALDASCTTDADCTTTGLWSSCCGVCEERYANKTYVARVQAFCAAHPPPKCPPMACSWGMSAPQCRAGTCQGRR